MCGGKYDDTADSSKCFAYDFGKNAWSEAGRMASARFVPGASSHPGRGLVITGGYDGSNVIDSVESTLDGVSFRYVL